MFRPRGKRGRAWPLGLNPPSRVIAPVLAIGLALGSSAPAQESPSASSVTSAGDVLAQLDAADFQTRQAATRTLLQAQTLDPERLRTLMRQSETLEQRQRLLTVARHHLLRRTAERRFADDQAGALGISHALGARHVERGERIRGIEVINVLPGFPAFAHLQPGDLIVEVDGKSLREGVDAQAFARLIKRHGRGNRLALTVIRRGERRRVGLTLGSVQALDTIYTRELHALSFRYAKRWRQAKAQYEQLLPKIKRLEPAR